MGINGVFYITLSIFVAGFSWFMSVVADKPSTKFILFYLFSITFFIIGLIKLIFGDWHSKGSKHKKHPHKRNHPRNHPHSGHPQNRKNPSCTGCDDGIACRRKI